MIDSEIAPTYKSTIDGGFIGLPVSIAYLANETTSLGSDARVVVEVDGIASHPSPKVVASSELAQLGVCSVLIAIVPVSSSLHSEVEICLQAGKTCRLSNVGCWVARIWHRFHPR